MTHQIDATGAIRDQALLGDTIVVSDDTCRAFVNSRLASGVLKLAQPKKAGALVMSTFQNCVIEAVKMQRDTNFFTARFVDCRFRGLFSGVDFGHTGGAELGQNFGSVEGCDFSDATLDGCRFINVDVSTLKFPRHDHAVLINPSSRSADVSAANWPGSMGKYMEIVTAKPPSFKATVMHIPSLTSLVQCSEEELKSALRRFGGIAM